VIRRGPCGPLRRDALPWASGPRGWAQCARACGVRRARVKGCPASSRQAGEGRWGSGNVPVRRGPDGLSEEGRPGESLRVRFREVRKFNKGRNGRFRKGPDGRFREVRKGRKCWNGRFRAVLNGQFREGLNGRCRAVLNGRFREGRKCRNGRKGRFRQGFSSRFREGRTSRPRDGRKGRRKRTGSGPAEVPCPGRRAAGGGAPGPARDPACRKFCGMRTGRSGDSGERDGPGPYRKMDGSAWRLMRTGERLRRTGGMPRDPRER
jgi:hypothetical protein